LLPISDSLDAIKAALRSSGAAVVHAPPGAGKTTVVPPALLDETWLGAGRIVMLEPRRLAARAAAQRMSFLRGEDTGCTIGYRTRLDTRVSASTRIEVVTEGVLTRMLQHDPTLDGYGLVIFDEFHERSLQADTGLALVLHTRRLVRPDLRVLVMSATLDGTSVAGLIGDTPVITSLGRHFDVETRYRPPAGSQRTADFDASFVTGAIASILGETEGDVLVFLPGAPEIHRVANLLEARKPETPVEVIPLHGSLDPRDQDRALTPAQPGRRKIVLATSIAETSLTIEGIRVVVDTGLSRRSRFSPRTGMSRLETVRVSRASAAQRRGRAGRTGPGICYRLWSEAENVALLEFAPPEIRDADLAPLALDLAVAGVTDPSGLQWLDAPPTPAFSQARELLHHLHAVDAAGHATDHGRSMAQFGMHPRLAHMILRAAKDGLGSVACRVAAILGERDPLRSLRDVVGVDLQARLDALERPREFPSADHGALRRAADQARRWEARLTERANSRQDPAALGRILALAFPERVGMRRGGPIPRYVLRNGTGLSLPEGDSLTREAFIVVAESDGRVPESRAWLAASIQPDDIETDFGDDITEEDLVEWSEVEGIRATRERRLGAIVLARAPIRNPDPELVAKAVAAGIRRLGLDVLRWTDGARRLRERLAFLHAHDPSWPDMSDEALAEKLLDRLADSLGRIRSASELQSVDVTTALLDLLDWEQRRQFDVLAPTHFEAPTGSRLPIDYSDPGAPLVAVRLQEMFGVSRTPTVFGSRVALTLQLLSPAQRPVQVTRDLAGFWRSSYYDVRKDLRARYPKHPWPEDPINAEPTRRARKRD
jgi:ATP-dependent helicase HrpB